MFDPQPYGRIEKPGTRHTRVPAPKLPRGCEHPEHLVESKGMFIPGRSLFASLTKRRMGGNGLLSFGKARISQKKNRHTHAEFASK